MSVPAPSGGRLYYLDALRAFCMLFGVLSHGATIGQNREVLFTFLKQTSDLFRMATFFAVAGFFTAMVFARRGWPGFVPGRVRLILIPLAAGLLVIAPVTNYLIHTWHNGPMTLEHYFLGGGWNEPSAGRDIWHLHLWFLFALFGFAMVTPALARAASARIVRLALDRGLVLFGMASIWITALAVGASMMALRAVQDQLLSGLLDGTRMGWIIIATLTYLPFYTLGVMMFLHRGVFDMMHRIDPAGLVLFGAGFVAFDLTADLLPPVVERIGFWMCKGGVIVFVIAALMSLFRLHMNRPSGFLTVCVDGAFSFYLFHLTAIYLVAHAMRPLTGTSYATFAVIVVAVPILTLGMHRALIAPFGLARLLFNGKAARRADTVAQGPLAA